MATKYPSLEEDLYVLTIPEDSQPLVSDFH